jgi:DNA-directed RNA polymerase subunit omega
MIYLPLEAFTDKGMSRYSLVVATAKRARQIVDGAKILIDTRSTKPVTIAMEEIASGEVFFEELGSRTK